MTSLYEQYEEIISGVKKFNWKYYPSNIIWNTISLDTLLERKGACDFINAYYTAGEKKNVLLRLEGDDNTALRTVHMISCFLLGFLIADALCEKSEEQENTFHDLCAEIGESVFEFRYSWFLMCLCHDEGYYYERGEGTKELNEQKWNQSKNILNKVLAHLEIFLDQENEPFDPLYRKIIENMLYTSDRERYKFKIKFKNDVEVSRGWYASKLIEAYFDYCRFDYKEGKWDHGIIGGYYFLNKAIMLYINKVRNYIKKGKNRITDPSRNGSKTQREYKFLQKGFSEDDLCFSINQLYLFCYIADCIKAHNVFRSEAESEEKYKKRGLQDITADNFKRISFCKDPLLYILSVTDTLEPIKNCQSEDEYRRCLESFKFEYSPGEKTIIISGINCKKKKSILAMPQWLECKCKEKGDIIEINLGPPN